MPEEIKISLIYKKDFAMELRIINVNFVEEFKNQSTLPTEMKITKTIEYMKKY